MEQKLKEILENLKDAGCADSDLKKAEHLCQNGDIKDLILFLRRCRCSRMEELRESQRKVDCLDYLIRQTKTEL